MEGAQIFFCEHCGKKISGTANFCRYCGARQNGVSLEEGIYGEGYQLAGVPSGIARQVPAGDFRRRSDGAEADRFYSGEFADPAVSPHVSQQGADNGVRKQEGPAADYAYHQGYSSPENSAGAKADPPLSMRQTAATSEGDFGDEDSDYNDRPSGKFSLFAKIAVLLLVIVFFFAAYSAVIQMHKPAVEVTKLVDMKNTWSFQGFINGLVSPKLSDFTGIQMDNVHSILIVLCGLMCLGFICWFYYTREYW